MKALARIIHASYASGEMRGGEHQLVLLVKQLAELGHHQVMVCRKESPLKTALSSFPNLEFVGAGHHLLDGLWTTSAEILHAHEARAAYWAALNGWRTGKPYVITRRILNPISGNWLSRRVYQHSAATIGVSQAVCDLNWREFARSAVCIRDAHQSLAADPQIVARIRAEIGGGPIIGQVAALVDRRKGQSLSIAAFEIIKHRFPAARLVFLGMGPDETMLRERAAGIEGIHFVGYQKDIGSWTAALDLVMLPSTRDALASSLLDAMHLGIPVVANRVGGIPEIARDGVSALLVDCGDVNALAEAAIQILDNGHLKSQLITGGREVAANASGQTMAKQHVDVYNTILHGAVRAAA